MNCLDLYGGYYTEGMRHGDEIEKKIKFHSSDEAFFYHQVFLCDREALKRYYFELCQAGVVMPKILAVNEENHSIRLKQTYISGKSLRDWISETYFFDDCNSHFFYFSKLLEYQRNAYQVNQNIRIDFNLKNFILHDREAYLVDIIPPIYTDHFETISKTHKLSNKILLLMQLYHNIDWQVTAIIGYWIQEQLKFFSSMEDEVRREKITYILMEMIQIANQYLDSYTGFPVIDETAITKNKTIIYHNKLDLLYRYMKKQISFSDMTETYYNLTTEVERKEEQNDV